MMGFKKQKDIGDLDNVSIGREEVWKPARLGSRENSVNSLYIYT